MKRSKSSFYHSTSAHSSWVWMPPKWRPQIVLLFKWRPSTLLVFWGLWLTGKAILHHTPPPCSGREVGPNIWYEPTSPMLKQAVSQAVSCWPIVTNMMLEIRIKCQQPTPLLHLPSLQLDFLIGNTAANVTTVLQFLLLLLSDNHLRLPPDCFFPLSFCPVLVTCSAVRRCTGWGRHWSSSVADAAVTFTCHSLTNRLTHLS